MKNTQKPHSLVRHTTGCDSPTPTPNLATPVDSDMGEKSRVKVKGNPESHFEAGTEQRTPRNGEKPKEKEKLGGSLIPNSPGGNTTLTQTVQPPGRACRHPSFSAWGWGWGTSGMFEAGAPSGETLWLSKLGLDTVFVLTGPSSESMTVNGAFSRNTVGQPSAPRPYSERWTQLCLQKSLRSLPAQVLPNQPAFTVHGSLAAVSCSVGSVDPV
ncbi:hypothetical protein PAMP_003540 [Pampus punctatissimus]